MRDRGNPLAGDIRVSDAVETSTDSYNRLTMRVRDVLWFRVGRLHHPDTPAGRIDFLNSLTDGGVLRTADRGGGGRAR